MSTLLPVTEANNVDVDLLSYKSSIFIWYLLAHDG